MPTYRLPYPPSVNHYWQHTRTGQTYVSQKGRAYREAVSLDVLAAGRVFVDGRIAINIDVHCPDKRTRDLDNILKGLLDSLVKAGVYRDDSQIDQLTMERGDVSTGGYVDVTIERIG